LIALLKEVGTLLQITYQGEAINLQHQSNDVSISAETGMNFLVPSKVLEDAKGFNATNAGIERLDECNSIGKVLNEAFEQKKLRYFNSAYVCD